VWREHERSVRRAVVLVDVGGKDVLEVSAAEDQQSVETLGAHSVDDAAQAFACGARTGVWMMRMLSLRGTSSTAARRGRETACSNKPVKTSCAPAGRPRRQSD
jgi:hypothetical protein